jgi:NitT/TauT family transport system substrate-binding protein
MANGQPKPAFYVAALVVIVGLIALALWRMGIGPLGNAGGGGQISSEELKQMKGGAEAPDTGGITTVKEYNYVPSAKLPEVKGISNYTPMADRTVRFAINVWAGWSPIIYANNGFKPGKVWKAPGGKDFRVELVLIDDPVAMRDAYAAGNLHVGWATLDMIPLFLEGLRKDSRVMPRVYQQVDWSNGGDGIVVRDAVKTMADLRGKTVVLAQNSPSHFFVLNALINAGVQPAEVDFKFTQDAFQAAAAFNADKNLAGVVSWAPDIYNLEKVKGNKIIVTTQTANKLIADVWFARADFAKDNPDIMDGITRGIFDAMIDLKQQEAKQKVAKLMAAGYSIPESDALGMLGDAHSTNYAENRDFFLNQNNPTNFERTWNTAYFLYKKIGAVTTATPFDQVMDFSVIQKLASEQKYASQKNEYDIQFAPATAGTVQGEKDEILTKTVVIHFFPNSWDVNKKVTRTVDGREVEEMYDPNVGAIVEEVGKLAGQYGAARIIIEGHTDGSMRNQVPKSLVQELSLNRANSVKEAILRKFPSLQPNQFSTSGMGWDRPADASDPENNAKNRRVEVKVYPAEATAPK